MAENHLLIVSDGSDGDEFNFGRLILKAFDSIPLRRRDLEFEIEPLLAFSNRLIAGSKFLPSLLDRSADRAAELLCVLRSYPGGRQSCDDNPRRCVRLRFTATLNMKMRPIARRSCHLSSAPQLVAALRSANVESSVGVLISLLSSSTAIFAASSAPRDTSAWLKPTVASKIDDQ